MALNRNNAPKASGGSKTEYSLIPMGPQDARLCMAVDLGTQERPPFRGEPKPDCEQLFLAWELLDDALSVEIEGETKRRMLFETVNVFNGADKGKEFDYYNGMDPSGEFAGDWGALVGKPCTVNIVHNPGKGRHEGKTFANISAVSPAHPRLEYPAMVAEPVVYEMNGEGLDKLYEFVQDKVKASKDWAGASSAPVAEGADAEEEREIDSPY